MPLNVNGFYIPHYNSFMVPVLLGVPAPLLITCLMFLLGFFLKVDKTKNLVMILILFLVTASIMLQFIAQWHRKEELARRILDKSLKQKKEAIWGSAFSLAYCARNKLKGGHYQGEFVSDLDSSSLIPSIFRYELYPVINLVSSGPDHEARVCFDSSQCSKLPKDYHLICQVKEGYVALQGEPNVRFHYIH